MSSSTPPPNTAFHLSYEDLRGWIAEADRLGELRAVTGASWQEEIGMAATLVSHSDSAPALLFDEVPGCPKGFRVLVNLFGGKRKNMSLGYADTDFDKVELSEAFAKVYPGGIDLIPPVDVDDGPVFENIMLGDEVDLEIFPTPIWHKNDGGRYIGTGCYHVTRDPDTGWVNLGSHRIMIYDRKTVGHNLQPGRHAGYHQEKYLARGERMPMAKAIGGVPVSMTSGDMIEAIERGQIDCIVGPIAWVIRYPILDSVKYVLDYPFGTFPLVGLLVMNLDAWKAHSPAQKAAVLKASPGAIARVMIDGYMADADKARAAVRAKKGASLVKGGKDFDSVLRQHRKKDMAVVIARAQKRGVKNPRKIVDAYLGNLAKWEKIMSGTNRDSASYSKLLWEKICVRIDPSKL